MAELTPSHVLLGKIGSVVGISQSIAWFVMSLICIIEYNIDVQPDQPDTLLGRFNNRIYYNYLYQDLKDLVNLEDTIVTPLVFEIFMIIYIILTTMWFVASCFQITVLKKSSINIPVVFKDWSIITFLIAIVDLVLVVLLSVDFNKLCDGTSYEDTCASYMIPLLVLAARGFALWLVNVFIAWKLYVTARFLRAGNEKAYEGTFGGILPIYRPVGYIPRVHIPPSPSLYSQQLDALTTVQKPWNVNLRTAMDVRSPPPNTPAHVNSQQFFPERRNDPSTPRKTSQQSSSDYRNSQVSPTRPYRTSSQYSPYYNRSTSPSPASLYRNGQQFFPSNMDHNRNHHGQNNQQPYNRY